MKTRLFIGLISLLAICVVVWLLTSHHQHSAATASQQITSSPTTLSATNGKSTLSANQNLANTSAPQQQDPKMKFIESLMATMNMRFLDFYGKVVDQNGAPVPKVKITARVGEYISITQSGGYDATTMSDSSGLFKFTGLHGAGNGFTLQKEGYVFDQRLPVSSRSRDYVPDPNHPVIFPMWKLKGAEPMIHNKLHVYIPCDGSTVSYNLLNGRAWGQDRDLNVQLTRNPVNINRGKPFDWSITLSIANGALQENNDTYPYEAPEDGYQSSITINMPANQQGWSPQIDKSYYFQSRGGKVYGRINIEVMANFQPPPTPFDVDIYANPSGSRNLEYDPSMRIKP